MTCLLERSQYIMVSAGHSAWLYRLVLLNQMSINRFTCSCQAVLVPNRAGPTHLFPDSNMSFYKDCLLLREWCEIADRAQDDLLTVPAPCSLALMIAASILVLPAPEGRARPSCVEHIETTGGRGSDCWIAML